MVIYVYSGNSFLGRRCFFGFSVWSGSGVALITLVGRYYFGQLLDRAALVGIGMIITGVIVLQLFSPAAPA